MPDGEDWILRPVIGGMCRYESLIDGSIGLSDLARMNEALDAQNENARRIQEHNKLRR